MTTSRNTAPRSARAAPPERPGGASAEPSITRGHRTARAAAPVADAAVDDVAGARGRRHDHADPPQRCARPAAAVPPHPRTRRRGRTKAGARDRRRPRPTAPCRRRPPRSTTRRRPRSADAVDRQLRRRDDPAGPRRGRDLGRPGPRLPQRDRQGRPADRRRRGRAGQAHRGRALRRRTCSRSRNDFTAAAQARPARGRASTASAPRTTCCAPTCAWSCRWPSATPATACRSWT